MNSILPISLRVKELKRYALFLSLVLSYVMMLNTCSSLYAQESGSIVRAGLRSSVYGFNSFPDTTWWLNATSDMASRFLGEPSPSVIWILGYTTDNGCYLNFPNPTPSTSYTKISFGNKDDNESYLNFFDRKGIKVWLQVEPGFADVSTIIDLVLTQYRHHSSVIGFGVDVEWYKTSSANNDEGEAVTDSVAEAWSTKVNSYNENYLLFTKHWLVSKMPPTFRTNMVFVDDSQFFNNLNGMVNEFKDWADFFAPAKVAFQFGYNGDKHWWGNLTDPPKNIGNEILNKCPNTSDLYWVDFTAYDIWPEDFNPTLIPDDFSLSEGFKLYHNYPNPFNPATKIYFTIPNVVDAYCPSTIHVILKVYDILCGEVATLVNEEKSAGSYEVVFDAANLSSGVYYYQLKVESFVKTRKMLLLR
ncbi:MAG: T9SS type A sorting domain-containing protein [Ignavibacteria bacterium]|jgi:hypothetical protein